MRLYKLTKPNLTTYGGHPWRVGEWCLTDGEGELCGPGWLHAYTSPLLAAMLNPIHADYRPALLWIAEGHGAVKIDNGLKVGVTKLRIVRQIPLPEPTLVQRTAFGILCADRVWKNAGWGRWAQSWLDGIDRTEAAAWAAAEAAAANGAAAWAAAAAAARAAAWAATVAEAAAAARAAAAAEAAAWAATANGADKPLNLHRIALQAMGYK